MALRNIIVVDDEQFIRDKTTACITKSDFGLSYSVQQATNGHEGMMLALELLRRKEIVSLIVCDIEMPVATGLDLIKSFKNNDVLNKIPILMVSSVNDKTKVIEAISLGANNYLLKPWKDEDLLAKMSACI